jgi:hypothetical protein
MDPQRQPVDASESVYRRVHRSFFQANLLIPIQAAAFRPNPHDTTGLSVFRARFVQPEDTLVGVGPGKRNDYFVVRFLAQDLDRLGLTLNPEPDPDGPPGHAVIPELSWQAYQANKQRLKQVQVELAKLASAAIVHSPS